MDTDEQMLPARMKAGEDAAFRDFAATFGPRLRRYFLWLGACPADAESLAVSTLSDVILKIDRYEDRGSSGFQAWAFRLARNNWVDDRRKALPALTYEVAEREASAVRPEVTRDIEAAIESLPETDRVIITARHFEGEMSFAAIGRKVGLSENATRVRHHRVLRRLAVTLAKYEPGGRRLPALPSNEEDTEDGC